MTPLKKYFSLSRPVLVPLFHLGVLFLAYKLLIFLSVITEIGGIERFKQWDSFWYASIAEKGYQYSTTEASNSGFFPLFSYIWKLSGLGTAGICYFNVTIFFIGMLMLKNAFNFSFAYLLLFLSIPGNMFMYVPYTEASFFFFSTIMLVGLKKNNRVMIFTGLYLASLTRPTAIFFIPAIICMEIFTFENLKNFLKNFLIYTSVSLLGIVTVVIFQFKATGVWFAYFIAQSHFWKRTLQLPDLPFTTWDGPRILWLEGFALFFGMLAAGILIIFLIRKIRKRELIENDKAIFFSLCYVMMALFSVVFFNGKDEAGGTTLMGANRYVLATPYFIILLYLITHHIKFEIDYWITFIILTVTTFFLLRVDSAGFVNYTETDKFYYRFFAVLNFGMYILASKHFNNRFIAMIYVINIVIQIIILYQFTVGRWIG